MPSYALYLESGPRRRKTMVHVLDLLGCIAVGPTTEAALGSAPGFSALHGAAGRGETALPEALRRTATLAADRVRATTPEERSAVRDLPAGPRTPRKALRRMLEHAWEHLVELSRRPGGR